jgi:hypothetical protein
MADSGPSKSTLKRLFALSGNRCAFPRCPAALAQGTTLIGEICHIKGRQPGSARYDASQSDEQRNSYANLLLLCPNHHTVIDDDVESYTVERLVKMKAEHEAAATSVSDADAENMAESYSIVMTSGQQGGITAQNVTAQNINLNTGPVGDTTAQRRQLQAIENVWQAACKARELFGAIIFVDSFMLANEMDEFFKTGAHAEAMAPFNVYRDQITALQQIASLSIEKERPFISSKLYTIFFVLTGLYGRTSLLVQLSFKKRAYQNWRDDEPLKRMLLGVLPEATVTEITQRPFGGLQLAVSHLEQRLLIESGAQAR